MLPKLFSCAFPLAMAVLFYGASSTPAHAYLDPGTGSMILQVLLGGLAGLALAGRFYWDKFLTVLRIRPAASSPSEDAERHAAARSKSQADK